MSSLPVLKSIVLLLLVCICATPETIHAQNEIVARTVARLNMRQGPSTEFDVILKLDSNEQVFVTGRNADGSWLYIKARDDTYLGWVSREYLSLSGNVPIMQLPLATTQNINIPTPIQNAPITNAPSTNGITISNLNVRAGDGTNSTVLGTVPARTRVIIEGRNAVGNWLVIHTADNQLRGWVVTRYVNFNDDISLIDLPIVTGLSFTAPNVTAPNNTQSQSTEGEENRIPPENEQPPINLTEAVINNVRAIYQRGQQLDRQLNSFIIIGESNSVPSSVYCSLGQGRYSLGQFSYLQSTVDLFDSSDSFCRFYETARAGYSTSYIVDPFWSNTSLCESNETLLLCEIRRRQPAFAIIYIGIGDHATTTPELFAGNIQTILQQLMDHGVIPIIFTYPMADVYNAEGTAGRFNDIIRDTALRLNVPLVDLRVAAWSMDNRGTGPDGYHLSQQPNHYSNIDSEQYVYGRTLREYLTLEILYQIIAKLGI